MKTRREYKRTCKRCTKVWYVPYGEAVPTKMKIRGERLNASGASLRGRAGAFGGGGSARARAVELQRQRDDALARQQCPECGSSAYDQETVAV